MPGFFHFRPAKRIGFFYQSTGGGYEKADKADKGTFYLAAGVGRLDRRGGGRGRHGVAALLLYADKAGEGAIGPVNGVIKVVCPCLAGFFAAKQAGERGTLAGALGGALFEGIMVLLLGLLLGEMPLTWAILGDFVICIATGMAGGMVRLLLGETKKQK